MDGAECGERTRSPHSQKYPRTAANAPSGFFWATIGRVCSVGSFLLLDRCGRDDGVASHLVAGSAGGLLEAIGVAILAHARWIPDAPVHRDVDAVGQGLHCADRAADVEHCVGTPVSYTHLRAHETRHDLVC